MITETSPDGTRTVIHPGPLSVPLPAPPLHPPRPIDGDPLPCRAYFCSVVEERSGSVAYIGELEAPTFGIAGEMAWSRARSKFPHGILRITSVVEQLDIRTRGPVSIALEITSHR